MTALYFAYGSNLWLPRLRHRVPGVEPLGRAVLPGFALRWHKRSRDGSGKCSIEPEPDARVEGGLFRIPDAERPALDRVEELGTGYDELAVTVSFGGVLVEAYAYVATLRARDEGLRPFTWYRDLVTAGAEWHRLSSPYVAALRSVQAVDDPDRARDRRQRAFLAEEPSMKPDHAEDRAREAAEAWLVHIDAGDPAAAWGEASSTFRGAVSEADWATSLGKVQSALGLPRERTFTSAEYHAELPGAPDGHYVILKFATRFERKEHGVETVVPELDVDGSWRVSGYFVK